MATNQGPSLLLSGGPEPAFIYGTAWKKDKTTQLVKDALAAGFRSVDTAAQPRHYQEDLVGNGLRAAFESGIVRREDVYIQTKYTTPAGQDINNMPYHPLDPLDLQLHTSVASSLKNLRPEAGSHENLYLDCLLLHSPLPTTEQTLQAWKILETYVPHAIKKLGISNVTLQILQEIYENSAVKPSVVQNRFYPATKYDVPLRKFCRENGITYQSFWTLTGNPGLMKSNAVRVLAGLARVTPAVALYSLVIDLGIVVLNGTSSAKHMEEDLAGIKQVRSWAGANEADWDKIRSAFAQLIAD